MRSLRQLFDEVNNADVFFGIAVTSVYTERFSGETALHIFSKWGDAEAIRTLVGNGAEIDKPGEDNNTPLHYAVMSGNVDAVKCLVDLGAKNLTDRYGNTPKQLAFNKPVIETFLEQNGF